MTPDVETLAGRSPRPVGQTSLPYRDPQAPRAARRRVGGTPVGERLNLVGAAVAGLSIGGLLFGPLAPLSGPLGFVIVSYVAFMLTYAVLTRLNDSGPAVIDRILSVLLTSAALTVFMTLVVVVAFTMIKGHSALLHLNFFTQDMQKAGPLSPVTVGGVTHGIVGTLWMIAIALVITVPLGIGAAVYLNEIGGGFSKFVRTIVDAMTALPSIVAGLLIYAVWILALGQEKSGFAAAMAISVMMLPIIIRASDVVLRLVPGNLREASAALGAPQWRTVVHVVLPTARSGLTTSVILGMARGIGETAPVLLTAGFTAALNKNPTNGPMVSLPLVAFNFVGNSSEAYQARGFAAAALLLLLVLILFLLARFLGGRGPGHQSKRQATKAIARSARDLARIDPPASSVAATARLADALPAPSPNAPGAPS